MSEQFRTITLSDRPPVRISDDDWNELAGAVEEEHDGQVRSQANRVSKWSIRVRQHEDGRAIVYAVYDYSTNWQNERGYGHKHGLLLTAEQATTEGICEAIKTVARRMEAGEHNGDDGERWARLADECIADLPAEDI